MNLFDPQFRVTSVRRSVYSLLAALFRHPSLHPGSDEVLKRFLQLRKGLPSGFRSGKSSLADLNQLMTETLRARRVEASESLSAEYHRLFGPAGTTPLGRKAFEEMSSFPQSPGALFLLGPEAGISNGFLQIRHSPGLILSQLQFLECMAAAEAECIMEEQFAVAERIRRKELVFLQEYLRATISNLSRLMLAANDFYRLLAATIDVFCCLDTGYLSSLLEEAVTSDSPKNLGTASDALTPYVSVSKDLCSLCGACQLACTSRALAIESESNSVRLRFLQERCSGCGACKCSCPEKAISIHTQAKGNPADMLLVEKILDLCPRCGRANDLALLSKVTLDRLGGSASHALREKLSLCRQCREAGPPNRQPDFTGGFLAGGSHFRLISYAENEGFGA